MDRAIVRSGFPTEIEEARTMRIVQLHHQRLGRRVAVVDEPTLTLLRSLGSVYQLALTAIERGAPLADVIAADRSDETLDYDAVYVGQSDWRLLPAFDHPSDPAHCLVTGTGLTHQASAANRDKMHQAAATGELNDSMRMYLSGVDGGKPAVGTIGVQPEWFYKGNGACLRAHGEALEQPAFADDAGEEPEVAVAYVVDRRGTPWRVGFAPGNEFADHVMEKKNYLYLAHSKLRQCAIGPELSLDQRFRRLTGSVAILRGSESIWSHEIRSGETEMAHSLENLEFHHFKYAEHRGPGQAHVHFLGASAFSFGAGVTLADGDVMEVAWRELGRSLRNPLRVDTRLPGTPIVATFRS
jgi:hypothetical protein